MYLCLGNEGAVDLGKALRESDDDRDVVAVIRSGVARKPKGHAFGSSEARTPRASDRSISLTGG
jgi:cyclic pyranopterin phosphate synthase